MTVEITDWNPRNGRCPVLPDDPPRNSRVKCLMADGETVGCVVILPEATDESDVRQEIRNLSISKPFRTMGAVRMLIESALEGLAGETAFRVPVKSVRIRRIFLEIMAERLIPVSFAHVLSDNRQYARYRFTLPGDMTQK